MTGYVDGPTLFAWQAPWPIQWESSPEIDDGHAHVWERVHLLADGQYRRSAEDVVRCRSCHVPRCGHSTDDDPCMERRHHSSLHIYLSGRFEPLGGLLPAEDAP